MPFDNPRLFVSYSRDDSAFAERLATDLRARGVNIWFDRLDIRTGAHWDIEVEAGLKASQGVLVILSPTSVASQNVMDEVSFAMGDGKRILPVLYQPCAIPLRLARLQYIDFVGSYDEGLTRLVADPTTPPPAARPTGTAAPAAPTPTPAAPSGGALRLGLLGAGGLVALVLLVLVLGGGTSDTPADTTPDDSARADSTIPAADELTPEPLSPRAGMVHPEHPHVVGAAEEGHWAAAPGYAWVNPADPADLRVSWTPGLTHTLHPHVRAGDEEGTWAVAPGYEWASPDDPNDLSVEPLTPAPSKS